MRLRRPLAALALAALVAAPACDGQDDRGLPRLPAGATAAVPPVPAEPAAPLCDAIPGDVVAEVTGRSPVTVDGIGGQCSWRADSLGGDGPEVVLQGSFIDARSFHVGRRDAAVAGVPDLGDDAYVVHAEDGGPATLYVLDRSRAFALWLAHPAPQEAEGTLAILARRVLAS